MFSCDGQVGVERELLRHVADLTGRTSASRHTSCPSTRPCPRERQQAAQGADQRRFARAVGAEQAKHLTFFDNQIDRVDCDKVPETDGPLVEIDDLLSGGMGHAEMILSAPHAVRTSA